MRDSLTGHRGKGFALVAVAAAILMVLAFAPEAGAWFTSWQDTRGPGNGDAYSLAYDPVREVLYRGTSYRGVWKYQGGNWIDMEGGMNREAIRSLAYDGVNNVLYAGTENRGLWRCTSPDTAPFWSDTGFGHSVYSLTLDEAGNRLYAGSNDDVYRLDDPHVSNSWENIGGVAGDRMTCLVYDGADYLYAGTGSNGVWYCQDPHDPPDDWSQVDMPFLNDCGIRSIVYDHDYLYMMTDYPTYHGGNYYVWRCENVSTAPNCFSVGSPSPGSQARESLVYDSTRGNLYALGVSSVWLCESPDFGPSWTDIGGGSSSVGDYRMDSIVYCDPFEDFLYAGSRGYGVWRCDDPDTTADWGDTEGGVSNWSITSIAYDGLHNSVYTGSMTLGGSPQYLGVWRLDSPDIAPAWTDIGGGAGEDISNSYVPALAYDDDPGRNRLYAGTLMQGVFRCDDPDTTHEWTNIGLDTHFMIRSLSHDGDRDILYAGSLPEGVWRCDNPGAAPAWTDISGAFSPVSLTCLVYDGVNNVLYAGTVDQGVWRCDNPDTSPQWNDTSGGLRDDWIGYLAFNRAGNKLFGGTIGCGVFYSSMGTLPSIVSCVPSTIMRGETGDITVSAFDTAFADGDSHATVSGDGITVNSVSVSSPTECTLNLTVDADAPLGPRDVNILTPRETVPTPRLGGLTVTLGIPRISGITPDAGPVGTTVAIDGVSFGESRGASFVTFNGSSVTEFASWSDTRIVCTVPRGATSGPVRVTTTAGVSDPFDFTVIGVPRISGISPTSGHTGTTITIRGEDFGTSRGTSQVTVSGRTVTEYLSWSDTEIKCKVPEDASTGPVKVTTVAGTSNGVDFTVTTPLTRAPTVARLSPGFGPVGTVVTITGADFGSSRGSATVEFNGVPVTDYRSWSDGKIVVAVPEGATTGRVTIKTSAGGSNSNNLFTVTQPVWYLAEGSTAWGYDCYVTVVNPNPEDVTIATTYMTEDGPRPAADVTLPKSSQLTVNPENVIGSDDFSTMVECKEGRQIAVDRTMTWLGEGAPSPDFHCSVGVNSPADTWYLPEGSSDWGFECWLLIQNPNDEAATCEVTYMVENVGPSSFQKEVPANSRRTYNMADDIGAADASIMVESDLPVIPERAMYRNNRRAGHDSIGTTSPSRNYYLAEGTTSWGFTTYVLIQNPNPEPASVTVTYMTSDAGPVPMDAFEMLPGTRKTIRVNDQLPGHDLSTTVTSDVPVIAERAMYWDYGLGEACHDSIGLDQAHGIFYLPDGQSDAGCETYTLIANPNDTDVTVQVSYLTDTGEGNVTKTEVIKPRARQTFNMLEHSGIEGRASIVVQGSAPIMVERAMYWNSRGGGADTIGGYSN